MIVRCVWVRACMWACVCVTLLTDVWNVHIHEWTLQLQNIKEAVCVCVWGRGGMCVGVCLCVSRAASKALESIDSSLKPPAKGAVCCCWGRRGSAHVVQLKQCVHTYKKSTCVFSHMPGNTHSPICPGKLFTPPCCIKPFPQYYPNSQPCLSLSLLIIRERGKWRRPEPEMRQKRKKRQTACRGDERKKMI